MKNLFGSFLILLGFASTSSAMFMGEDDKGKDIPRAPAMFMDEPLGEHTLGFGTKKSLGPVKQSRIYGENLYFEVPMVHAYNHVPVISPFAGTFLRGNAPQEIEHFLSSDLKDHHQVYFFVVQGIPDEERHPNDVKRFKDMQTTPVLSNEDKKKLSKEELERYEANVRFYELNKHYWLADKKLLTPDFALKPQYFFHSGCPTFCNKSYEDRVKWMVIRGSEAPVQPVEGPGLLSSKISTHPHGLALINLPKLEEEMNALKDNQGKAEKAKYESKKREFERITKILKKRKEGNREVPTHNGLPGIYKKYDIDDTPDYARVDPDYMILSGNVMHIKGFSPLKSTDSYDLVACKDAAVVTYRWMLTKDDLETFTFHLEKAKTFRELMTSLEIESSFKVRLDELKKYTLPALPDQRVLSSALNAQFDMDEKTMLPKGWQLVKSSGNRDISKHLSFKKYPKRIEVLGDNYTFYNNIPSLNNYDQTTFLFSVELRGTKPGTYIQYWDGVKSISSAPYNGKGKGEWETLAVEFTVDAQNARFHRLYAAILGATKGTDNPSVDIRSIKLEPKKL